MRAREMIREIFSKSVDVILALIVLAVFIAAYLTFPMFFGEDAKQTARQFVGEWKKAVESGSVKNYKDLWDSKALRSNRIQYDRVRRLVARQERIEVDLTEIAPRKDFKNDDRYRIEGIPVTIYEGEEVLINLRHDLTVEKKGLPLLKRWKIISEQIRDKVYVPDDPDEELAVPINKPPKAAFDFEAQPAEGGGHYVNFEVRSTDDEGIEEYAWNFGDGTKYKTELPYTSHVYASSGTFTVYLMVKNAEGLISDPFSREITLLEQGQQTPKPEAKPDDDGQKSAPSKKREVKPEDYDEVF